MKKLLLPLILIITGVTIIILSACRPKEGPDCHLRIKINNSAEFDIYISHFTYVPNTPYNNNISEHYITKAGGGGKEYLGFAPRCIESWFHSGRLYFNIAVIDVDHYNSLPKEKRTNINLLKWEYFSFTLEELQQMNWEFTYIPGTGKTMIVL